MSIVGKVSFNIKMAFRSLFWKKDKGTVVIGSWFGERFADNSRFLFQYLSENKDKLGLNHVVWATHNETLFNTLHQMGYEVCMMGSEESAEIHKKAAYHIICDSPNKMPVKDKRGQIKYLFGDLEGQYSFRTKRINLWHGTGGLKAVGMSTNMYKNKRKQHPILYSIKEFILYHSRFYQTYAVDYGGWGRCYQLSTAPIQTQTLHESSARAERMCIESAYPRNCECPRLLPEEEEVINLMKGYSGVILYLPTFRTNSSFAVENLAEQLADVLRGKNILWIEKTHSVDLENASEEKFEKNIIRLNPSFDISTIMPYISILVTDYSSARMDAMYHNKPTVFYVPDFDEYMKGDNGFFADPNEVMCGPKVATPSELKRTIEEYWDNPETLKTKNYNTIRTRYWAYERSLSEIWLDIRKVVG